MKTSPPPLLFLLVRLRIHQNRSVNLRVKSRLRVDDGGRHRSVSGVRGCRGRRVIESSGGRGDGDAPVSHAPRRRRGLLLCAPPLPSCRRRGGRDRAGPRGQHERAPLLQLLLQGERGVGEHRQRGAEGGGGARGQERRRRNRRGRGGRRPRAVALCCCCCCPPPPRPMPSAICLAILIRACWKKRKKRGYREAKKRSLSGEGTEVSQPNFGRPRKQKKRKKKKGTGKEKSPSV